MSSAHELAKHCLQFEPGKNTARLAFYHFLANEADPQENVRPELINRYFLRALSFEHWRNHSEQLESEAKVILHGFIRKYRIEFDYDQIVWPSQVDLFEVLRDSNWSAVVEQWLAPGSSHYKDYRLVPEENNQCLLILLRSDDGLEIRNLRKSILMWKGRVQPFDDQLHLVYDENLSFALHHPQKISIAPSAVAKFRFNGETYSGRVIKGYTFQRGETFDAPAIENIPHLFYPIKRIERHFIHRKSDPIYNQIVQALERALDLVRTGHPEAMRFASEAHHRAKIALEQIFPDDNLIRLAINSLEVVLQSTQNQPLASSAHEKINHSPIADHPFK